MKFRFIINKPPFFVKGVLSYLNVRQSVLPSIWIRSDSSFFPLFPSVRPDVGTTSRSPTGQTLWVDTGVLGWHEECPTQKGSERTSSREEWERPRSGTEDWRTLVNRKTYNRGKTSGIVSEKLSDVVLKGWNQVNGPLEQFGLTTRSPKEKVVQTPPHPLSVFTHKRSFEGPLRLQRPGRSGKLFVTGGGVNHNGNPSVLKIVRTL